MELALLLIFGASVVAILLTRRAVQSPTTENAWANAAERLGLDSTDHGISGEYDGVDVAVRQDRSLDSRGSYIVGKATFEAEAVPRDLKIYRETLVEKMGKLIGSEDVELGTPELDRELIVKTANAAAVREWASDATVARGLQDLAALSASLKIDAHEITVQLFVETVQEDQLVELIKTLSGSARALSGRADPASVW